MSYRLHVYKWCLYLWAPCLCSIVATRVCSNSCEWKLKLETNRIDELAWVVPHDNECRHSMEAFQGETKGSVIVILCMTNVVCMQGSTHASYVVPILGSKTEKKETNHFYVIGKINLIHVWVEVAYNKDISLTLIDIVGKFQIKLIGFRYLNSHGNFMTEVLKGFLFHWNYLYFLWSHYRDSYSGVRLYTDNIPL